MRILFDTVKIYAQIYYGLLKDFCQINEYSLICLILLLFFSWGFKYYYYPKPSLDQIKQSPRQLLYYLDKYYLVNKWYAFIGSFIYIFVPVYILLFLRSYFLGKEFVISQYLDISTLICSFSKVLFLFKFVLIVIIFIVIFYFLLDILFYDEIIKLYLYYLKSTFVSNLSTFIQYVRFYPKTLWGSFYLFFDNISKLKKDISDDDNDYEEYYIYSDIYDNLTIKNISDTFVMWAKKYYVVQCMFKAFAKTLRLCYKHLLFNGLLVYIPLLLLFGIIFYDFQQGYFFYSYYAFYAYGCLQLFLRLFRFFVSKSSLTDFYIHEYFYKNTLDYKIQRVFFSDKNLMPSYLSMENTTLYRNISYDIAYVLNDFKSYEGDFNLIKKVKAMYFRVFVICILLMLSYILILDHSKFLLIINAYNIKLNILVLLVPIIAIMFINKNVFKLNKKDPEFEDNFVFYVYSKKYNYIFWLLVCIQLYIFWLLLVVSNIFVISDDVLWEGVGVEIIRLFTFEEKVLFYYNHFEFCMQFYGKSEDYVYSLRSVVEAIPIKDFILEKTTIRDLHIFIDSLIEQYDFKFEQLSNEKDAYKKTIRAFGDAITNIINLIIFFLFGKSYSQAFFIIKTAPNFEISKLILLFIKLLNK